MRWMIDVHRWQVSQGRFFVHEQKGNVPVNAELCAMKSILVSRVDPVESLPKNWERIHNNFFQVDIRGNWAQCSSDTENCVLVKCIGSTVDWLQAG